ncbi:glycosyltransferase family 2 protein [Myroides phaeus]|uniref:glycosyltransferase family A protein n=1 Tax=Myroides phaeus TaxID=702745 RepID=UPI002DB86C0D|nr:glycosyltransferase family 2 protein [Myroides phaeus]MEC4116368.1 glycosyltransferase family 2 protein [Myroides phaeus]
MNVITIAIPFYNAEKYLGEAVDSVLSQTYKEWKLLLIDDGSTDSSLDLARKYEKLDSRITVFSDGDNKNLGYRLNQVPYLVNSKYLARMDADDIMHPSKIEKQLLVLEKHPEIDVLGTNAYTIDEMSLVFGVRNHIGQEGEFVKVESFIHPTIIATTQWFRDNPYDVDAVRMEDAELWFRTKDQCCFCSLSEPLFFYREFGKDYYKKYFATYKSKKYILSKYRSNKYWSKYFKKLLLKSIIYRVYSFLGKEQFLINRRNVICFNVKTSVLECCDKI